LYFNVSITSRELQTSRLGLVSVLGDERLGLVLVSSFYVSCSWIILSYWLSLQSAVGFMTKDHFIVYITQQLSNT